MNEKITFVVFTYNEARRIEYILRCFKPYGRIIVMDNHSTDATADIARSFGAEVHLHRHPGYVEEESVARNVLSKVTTDWVYWAFADEILPHPLLRKLREVSEGDQYKLVIIPRKNLHYGISNLNLGSGASPRFFRKGSVDFTGNPIHSMGRFTGDEQEILRLPVKDAYAIHHCSTYDLRKFELAHSSYSEIESRLPGKRFSPFKMLFYPPYFFLRSYLLGGALRSGWAGFIMTMQYCFFFFNVQAKIWEQEQGITLESIEKNYDAIKEDILGER
jgi:glycosyltransferase involved in cell wall biosynthesis